MSSLFFELDFANTLLHPDQNANFQNYGYPIEQISTSNNEPIQFNNQEQTATYFPNQEEFTNPTEESQIVLSSNQVDGPTKSA